MQNLQSDAERELVVRALDMYVANKRDRMESMGDEHDLEASRAWELRERLAKQEVEVDQDLIDSVLNDLKES